MPSFVSYSCPGGKAQLTPCSNLASTTAGSCPNGCYPMMLELNSAAGDSGYMTSLQTRYGAGCNYYTYVVNLQNNWNTPRSSDMVSVQNSLNTVQSTITSYDSYTQTVQANISSFTTILNSNFDSITNLTAGSFNGVDCRVIGESILDLRDSLCIGILNSINYNITCLVLLCYGVLLMACFGVCASVRHFKHLQLMQVHVGYKGVPVMISEQRFN